LEELPVKQTLALGVLATIMAMSSPGFAQQPATLDRIMRELEALSARVGKLEQENSALATQNAELREQNDRLEATSDYLRANASDTRKQLAEDAPVIADAAKMTKSAEWASRLTWKGDLRYRHENVNPEEAATDQTRERVRARVGLTAKVNDTVSATVQLATTGGNNDPRSTNQTLGEGWTRKGIGVDLAYIDWKPVNGLSLQLGKMTQPWQRVGTYIWDNDITPEGIAAKYTRGAFFGSAFSHWLSERSGASDSRLIGGQLGLTGNVGDTKLMGAVGYFDARVVEGQVTAAATGCTVNNAFFGGAQGNTTVADASGCLLLANDFNMLEGVVQAELAIGSRPLTLFGDYIQNVEADSLDTGYALGFTFGKASNPMTWDFSYAYQFIEKDAQFGQFVDSDFGGGITDTQGSVFKVGFAPAANWLLSGTYFMNERSVDVATSSIPANSDYDRYQIDLSTKF
jgi:hypothetical protein